MSTTVKKLQTLLGRRATMIDVGKWRPPDDPAASWFGRVNVGLAGERWPEHDGFPMLPVVQVNLSEAPYVPPALADVAMLTVFLGHGELPADAPNGDGWLLRPIRGSRNSRRCSSLPTRCAPYRTSSPRAGRSSRW